MAFSGVCDKINECYLRSATDRTRGYHLTKFWEVTQYYYITNAKRNISYKNRKTPVAPPTLGVADIVLTTELAVLKFLGFHSFYIAKAINIRLVKMKSHSSNGIVSPLKVIVMAEGLFLLDAQINTFKCL